MVPGDHLPPTDERPVSLFVNSLEGVDGTAFSGMSSRDCRKVASRTEGIGPSRVDVVMGSPSEILEDVRGVLSKRPVSSNVPDSEGVNLIFRSGMFR